MTARTNHIPDNSSVSPSTDITASGTVVEPYFPPDNELNKLKFRCYETGRGQSKYSQFKFSHYTGKECVVFPNEQDGVEASKGYYVDTKNPGVVGTWEEKAAPGEPFSRDTKMIEYTYLGAGGRGYGWETKKTGVMTGRKWEMDKAKQDELVQGWEEEASQMEASSATPLTASLAPAPSIVIHTPSGASAKQAHPLLTPDRTSLYTPTDADPPPPPGGFTNAMVYTARKHHTDNVQFLGEGQWLLETKDGKFGTFDAKGGHWANKEAKTECYWTTGHERSAEGRDHIVTNVSYRRDRGAGWDWSYAEKDKETLSICPVPAPSTSMTEGPAPIDS
jgi:hypothetical protein